MSKGFLVAVDGIDGSGKTTMANLVHDELYAKFGARVMKIQYSGATVLGAEIRKLVKSVKADLKIDPVAERLLFCADNIQTLRDVVIPGLKDGMVSNTLQTIQSLAPHVLPDLYILLRCSQETSKARRGVRQTAPIAFGIDQWCRIEEQGDLFMARVFDEYNDEQSVTMRRAHSMSKKVVIVDANEGIVEAKKSVMDAINSALMVL